jgi:hypothetical protein
MTKTHVMTYTSNNRTLCNRRATSQIQFYATKHHAFELCDCARCLKKMLSSDLDKFIITKASR